MLICTPASLPRVGYPLLRKRPWVTSKDLERSTNQKAEAVHGTTVKLNCKPYVASGIQELKAEDWQICGKRLHDLIRPNIIKHN